MSYKHKNISFSLRAFLGKERKTTNHHQQRNPAKMLSDGYSSQSWCDRDRRSLMNFRAEKNPISKNPSSPTINKDTKDETIKCWQGWEGIEWKEWRVHLVQRKYIFVWSSQIVEKIISEDCLKIDLWPACACTHVDIFISLFISFTTIRELKIIFQVHSLTWAINTFIFLSGWTIY